MERRGKSVFGLLLCFSIFSNSLNIPLSERKAEAKKRAKEEQTRRTDLKPCCPSVLSGQHLFVHVLITPEPAQTIMVFILKPSSSSGPVQQSSLLWLPGSPSSSVGPDWKKAGETS